MQCDTQTTAAAAATFVHFFVVRANDFLEFCTERFLRPAASALSVDDAGTGERLVLDLGCGNGRDTVYMAQNLPPGTRVVGVDNHSYALERGAGLAEQWLDNTSSRDDRDGSGGGISDGGSEEGAMRSRQGAESDWEERGEETSDPDGHGKANNDCPNVRRRACQWLLTDLRKEGSLDGLRACVVHGHRFKCEQLLPLLRDDVRGIFCFFMCPFFGACLSRFSGPSYYIYAVVLAVRLFVDANILISFRRLNRRGT